jgi:hypothetical protein
VSRSQSQTDSVSNSYTYRTRNQKLVCQDIKIKRQKEAAPLQGDGPDFGRPFMRMSHVRAASPRLATPRHATARPGQARRASARVWSSLSLLNTPLRVVERTRYIKRSNSSSTSGMELNFSTTSCHFIHGPLFKISEIAMGLAHYF